MGKQFCKDTAGRYSLKTFLLRFQDNSCGKSTSQRDWRNTLLERHFASQIPGKTLQENNVAKTMQEDIVGKRLATEIPGKQLGENNFAKTMQEDIF